MNLRNNSGNYQYVKQLIQKNYATYESHRP